MLSNVLRWRNSRPVAGNENMPECTPRRQDAPSPSNVRAFATGAALAVSLDATPAVLVSIYDYAHRYRDKGRRSA